MDVLFLYRTHVHATRLDEIKFVHGFNSCFSVDVNGRSRVLGTRELNLVFKD